MSDALWQKIYGIFNVIKKITGISVFLILIILTLFAVCSGMWISNWLHESPTQNTSTTRYYLKPGLAFAHLAADLERAGVLTHPTLFTYYARLTGDSQKIKVGTYDFTVGDTPLSILEKLVLGETVTIKVTLPEGINMYQVADKLVQYFPNSPKEIWLLEMTNPELLQYMGLKDKAQNLEGFLFPNSYLLDPNADPHTVLKNILIEFKKNIPDTMFAQAAQFGLTPLEFVTLASIIEKETGVGAERNKVSAVYWNRLKIKMRLQADPTVIYGMWQSYNGNIRKKDLLTPTPYNTYTEVGLPPGPIASPGKEALLATLNPAPIKALYFVASGNGTHVFSKTLEEHNRAVASYLRVLREKRK